MTSWTDPVIPTYRAFYIRGQILNTVFPCVFGEETFRTYMDQSFLLLDSLYIEAGILIIMFSITRTIGTHIFI